jgi:hypothetical protein
VRRTAWAVSMMIAVTATTMMAVPARASGSADCFDVWFPTGPESVAIEGLRIDVYPDRVGDDVAKYAGWAVDNTVVRVLCVEGGVVTGKVQCFIDKLMEIVGSMEPTALNFRYVYPNEGGGYTIDGNQLAADITAC